MELEEAKEVMDSLYAFYPHFNKNGKKDFDKIWLKKLMQGDYEKTLKKTNEYTESSKFAPSLADVFVPIHKPVNNELTDIQAARETVKKEKSDPALNAKREKVLQKFDDFLEELKRNGK